TEGRVVDADVVGDEVMGLGDGEIVDLFLSSRLDGDNPVPVHVARRQIAQCCIIQDLGDFGETFAGEGSTPDVEIVARDYEAHGSSDRAPATTFPRGVDTRPSADRNQVAVGLVPLRSEPLRYSLKCRFLAEDTDRIDECCDRPRIRDVQLKRRAETALVAD